MRQLQRQGLVAAMEGYPVQRPTAIAIEGFRDFLHDLVFRKIKAIHREDLSKVWHKSDELKSHVHETIANGSWVAKHFENRQIHVGKRDLEHLIVNGKIVKPVEAMEFAHRKMEHVDHAQNGAGEFEAYAAALSNGLKEIEAFYKSQHPPKVEVVEKFAGEVIAKIKVPGQKQHDQTKRHEDRVRREASRQMHGAELPQLTQDDIVRTGAAVMNALDVLKEYRQKAWMRLPTSDFDEEFWEDKPDYKGQRLRVSRIGDFFYEQGIPDEASSELRFSLYDYQDTIVAAIAWATLLCGGEKLFDDPHAAQ